MNGKICVVTGATSGIGFETAMLLAEAGAEVIGVGRDPERCAAAAARIRAAVGGSRVRFETADLSSQAEVMDLAACIRAAVPRVDVLVNNAGIFTCAYEETVDGIELQLAVNHLAGFLLTLELMPRLAASDQARVIGVSSGSHFAGRMHWDDLGMRRAYFGLSAYDQSKLAVVLFTRELARRLGPHSRLTVCAVDPGLVRTEIGAKRTGFLVRFVWDLRTRRGISPRESAGWIARLAADPSAALHSGCYWKEGRETTPSAAALSDENARRLWRESERMCCGADSAGIFWPARDKTSIA